MKAMSKILNLFIVILSISALQSQNYNAYSKQFDKSYGGKYEVNMLNLKRFGFHDVFKYNANELIKNTDSIHILSKIKYVSVQISENLNLKTIVENLEKLPNLEYLKFVTPASLFRRGKVKNIVFPNNIYKLKKVKTISLKGDFYWNYGNFIIEISKMPQLENLAIVYNNFPNKFFKNLNFSKLKHLKGLSYSGSNKIEFPKIIKDFKNLTSLNLRFDSSENSMKELNKFSSIASLKFLSLGYMHIDYTVLENFTNLKELSLSSIEIKKSDHFFLSISKIKTLERLILVNNKLLISKEIPNLPSLNYFFSANDPIGSRLPNQFYNFLNLTDIEIQGSKIEIISDNLNQLINLKSLKLHYNKIKKLPKSMANLSNLKKLYLNHNKIRELPREIGSLKLSYLSLNNNLFQELPNSLTNLINLDTLNLEENYITQLPKKIGNLQKLKYFNLELNNVKKLPKSIGKLKKLEYLNISRNKITYLPNSFGKLSRLNILDAQFCLLTELPASFGNLVHLENLLLTNNNLKSLSKNFGKLISLKKLYLNNRSNSTFVFNRNFKKDSTISLKILDNNITLLPKSFTNLKELKFIDLSLNKNIEEKQLFLILKKSKFKNYEINLGKCNIKVLPTSGWNFIKATKLDVRDNLITKIPSDIINAKYLTILNLNRNKGINTYRANKTQLALLYVEKGFIEEDSIKKTAELVIAYAKTANGKISNKEYKKGVEYAEKALTIDKVLTYKHLYEDNYIEALYYTKNYLQTIAIANKEIKKDTAKQVRFLNSIIPNFKYKAKSELALGDTIKAINTFVMVSKKFSGNEWTRAGMLSKKIRKDALSKECYEESYKFYTLYLKNNPKSWGYHLSLIEAYIISNQIDLAQIHLEKIKKLSPKDKNYKSLISYFNIIIEIIKNENVNLKSAQLKSQIKVDTIKLKSWSFQLMEDWIVLSSLNHKQKLDIINLNNLYN
jgi:Leucine-rich repeat (LRR) protein